MAGKLQFIGLALFLFILSNGCSETEQKRTRLLEEVEHNFENADAHFELAQLYEGEHKWELAEYHYDIALGFDPSHRDMQAKSIKDMKTSGNTAKAQQLAERYIIQASTSAVQSLKLAMAFQKQGLDDYALESYKEALSLAPNSSRTNREIGYYYLIANDNEHAKEYFMKSFKINPKQNWVADELGRLGVPVRIP
jgi:Tfp pilus assembly protein PilF